MTFKVSRLMALAIASALLVAITAEPSLAGRGGGGRSHSHSSGGHAGGGFSHGVGSRHVYGRNHSQKGTNRFNNSQGQHKNSISKGRGSHNDRFARTKEKGRGKNVIPAFIAKRLLNQLGGFGDGCEGGGGCEANGGACEASGGVCEGAADDNDGAEGGAETDEAVLLNPEENEGAVNYALDGYSFTMDAGQHQAIGSTSRVITFDRGNDNGEVSYTLTGGSYEFVITKQGWDLRSVSQ